MGYLHALYVFPVLIIEFYTQITIDKTIFCHKFKGVNDICVVLSNHFFFAVFVIKCVWLL